MNFISYDNRDALCDKKSAAREEAFVIKQVPFFLDFGQRKIRRNPFVKLCPFSLVKLPVLIDKVMVAS
jgi:hypothetical protein